MGSVFRPLVGKRRIIIKVAVMKKKEKELVNQGSIKNVWGLKLFEKLRGLKKELGKSFHPWIIVGTVRERKIHGGAESIKG